MLKRLLFAVLMLLAFAAQATVYSLPWGPKPQFVDANGAPMSSGTLSTFLATSSTPQVTYTDSTGGVANPTTITLNTRGETPNEVWLTGGIAYKLVLKDSSGATIWTVDGVSGVNDISSSVSEWITGPAPTFVSATSLTLAGDQTQTFTVGRRIKTTNSGGTIYSIITASSFGVLTTLTVANDSGVLDNGLSAVSYGILAATNESAPPKTDVYPIAQNATDRTKRMTLSLSGLTTATNRTGTAPDSNFNLGMPRNYLAGLAMSAAGGSATLTVAAGAAKDSTNVADITLAASLAKTTAAWTVGAAQGCLDTGVIANTTWYHFWLILRPDTGVVDWLCSLSATAPTMPGSYTYKRRIGAAKTDGAAQWVKFAQLGDLFTLDVPVGDVNVTNPGTAAVTRTLASVPTGIVVVAWFSVDDYNGATNHATLFTALDQTDSVPSATIFSLDSSVSAGSTHYGGDFYVKTNTSAQIRSRQSASGVADALIFSTKGWIDRRGRDD